MRIAAVQLARKTKQKGAPVIITSSENAPRNARQKNISAHISRKLVQKYTNVFRVA